MAIWNERKSEQKKLLEEIIRSARDAARRFVEEGDGDEDRSADRLYMLAIHDLIAGILFGGGGPYCRRIGQDRAEMVFIDRWLREEVSSKLSSFSLAEEELKILMIKLLKKFADMSEEYLLSDYLNLAIGNEEKYFGAEKTTSEATTLAG